jgi:hypothetical protein
MAGYELRTLVVEPKRNTYEYLVERFGDRPASRYQEGSYNVQSMSNFHYRPTWDADREVYDPNYTALRLTDPYGYKDPRQYYYTPYVANAAERFESFAQTLKYVEDRRLLDKMPENWHVHLTGFVLPLRHYESAAQLISSNASRFAWGTTVSQPMAFASFDRIGNAQQELDWLSASYPDTFDRYYRPVWERAQRLADSGHRFFNRGLPMLCQTCQIPMAFTEPGDPGTISVRSSEFRGERFNHCSDGCKWIFDREPEKYVHRSPTSRSKRTWRPKRASSSIRCATTAVC